MEKQYATLREKIAAEKAARIAQYNDFEALFNRANRKGYAEAEAKQFRD